MIIEFYSSNRFTCNILSCFRCSFESRTSLSFKRTHLIISIHIEFRITKNQNNRCLIIDSKHFIVIQKILMISLVTLFENGQLYEKDLYLS